MAHTFSCLVYHLVFSTAGRRNLINEHLEPLLHAYIGGVIRNINGEPLTVGGTANHVHILMALRPITSPADAVRAVKTNSSKWIHENFANQVAFAWQEGYGVFSISRPRMSEVIRYIADQRKHHQNRTFEEEFLAMLNRYGVQYDARFVLD